MGVGQELTNALEGVGHVFSFMLKQKKSPLPPHINNDRSLRANVRSSDGLMNLFLLAKLSLSQAKLVHCIYVFIKC